MEKDTYTHTCGGYNSGHPWYYVRGGTVLPPKAILKSATTSAYRGYAAEDIAAADKLEEPRRSHTLRAFRDRFLQDYRADLSCYRDCARQLHALRKAESSSGAPTCRDVHTSISLKHNHLYNDLAHLAYLDDLLSVQGDLFG